jgi:hypothetical protein
MHFSDSRRNSEKVQLMISYHGNTAFSECHGPSDALETVGTAVDEVSEEKKFSVFRKLFQKLFERPVTPVNIADSIDSHFAFTAENLICPARMRPVHRNRM